MVTLSACGTSVSSTRRMTFQATPFAISCARLCMIGGSMSTKVRPTRRSSNGATISRTRYRSMIFTGGYRQLLDYHRYDARRLLLAHASAVLRRPRHAGAHPAVGAAPRPEGLLRDGRAAARVSRREDDVQSGPVAARATAGVCRRSRPRSLPGTEPEAGDGARLPRHRLHPRELLPRAAPAHDRRLPALRRAAGATGRIAADAGGPARRRDAVHRRRSARPAGLAEARVDRSAVSRHRPARALAAREGTRLLRTGQA